MDAIRILRSGHATRKFLRLWINHVNREPGFRHGAAKANAIFFLQTTQQHPAITIMKIPPKRLLYLLLMCVCLTLVLPVRAEEKNYRFVMVSHIGSNDPNMNWLTTSM